MHGHLGGERRKELEVSFFPPLPSNKSLCAGNYLRYLDNDCEDGYWSLINTFATFLLKAKPFVSKIWLSFSISGNILL